MSARLLILDIAGSTVAFSSSSRAVAQWATSVRPCLAAGEIPPGMALSIDVETGQSDAGGLSLRCTDISDLLVDVGSAPITTLDGDHTASTTSINLVDASALPSNGKIWIGQECISYISKVGNALTATGGRGALGTYSLPHYDTAQVFAENPSILGRRVELSWQDARVPSTSTAWTRFVGFLDSIGWQDGYYVLRIISASKLATDQKVLATAFSKGKLGQDWPGVLGDLYLDHDGDTPWSIYSNVRNHAHIQIGDEIIKIERAIRPAHTQEVLSFTSPNRLFVRFPNVFWVGQKLDITDNVGAVKVSGVTVAAIFNGSSSTSYVDVSGAKGYSHSSGDKLAANYTTLVPKGAIARGQFGTEIYDHEANEEAVEVRALIGDMIEQVLLPLLCSVDGSGTHGPGGGAYDILPAGWGAGVDSAFVDLAALQVVARAGRAGHRRYLWKEPVQLSELLAWAAQTLNATVLWTELGKLSATLREDLYPGTEPPHSVSASTHREGQYPSLEIRMDKLFNAVEVKSDLDPITGEATHTIIVEIDDSVQRYGRRHLEINDPGVLRSESEETLRIALQGWLRYRSLPYPEVTVPVILQENVTYRPGDLVALSILHLPDMNANRTLSGTWEILEVSPSDSDGKIDLRMIYRGIPPRVAHIAPAGIVASVDAGAKTVTFEAAATTYLAPSTAYSPVTPGHDGDGTEDSDWFAAGDYITFWDVSSFGSAASENALITVIDYGTRTITVDALPSGFTLAAGDVIKFRDYAGFSGAITESQRKSEYLALADSTASPPDIGGDDAFLWGM